MTCRRCAEHFEISETEHRYLKALAPQFGGQTEELPPSRLCPNCRHRRRLSFRNERKLHHRTCDLTGQKTLSVYAPDSPYTVYENRAWWSDAWDPLNYGREFDFSRTFFEQFAELYRVVPKAALIAKDNENCDYVNYAMNCKDCYLVLGWGEKSEHCLYGNILLNCRDCIDVTHAADCELCYESIDIENCYQLFFSQSCRQCSESYYLKNCVGCSQCFGCINLVNRRHCIFNEQYSEADYQSRLPQLLSTNHRPVLEAQLVRFFAAAPHKYLQGINVYESTGDYLRNCRNVVNCYNTTETEDGMYLYDCVETKYCLDVSLAGKNHTAFSYECVNYTGYHCLFSSLVWLCSDLIYCQECFNATQDCFGCTGLTHRRYCILNRQYARDDYFALCRRIVAHMRETGEWGEFFPEELAPFAYNESMAIEAFPLTKEEAQRAGFRWTDESRASTGPNRAARGDDRLVVCTNTKRHFRLTSAELEFYQRYNLPKPTLHPDERHRLRLGRRNPRTLWRRRCSGCAEPVETTFAPDRPERIYCEQCYHHLVWNSPA